MSDAVSTQAPLKSLSGAASIRPNLSFESQLGSFDRAVGLRDYVRSLEIEEPLWQALTEAAGKLPPALAQAAPCGVVIAREPLIGLAVIAAKWPDILVPLCADEGRGLTGAEGISSSLAYNSSLGEWLDMRENLAPPTAADSPPMLMRAWRAPHQGLATAFRDSSRVGSAQRGGIICLVRSVRGEASELPALAHAGTFGNDSLLADVSECGYDILLAVVAALGLPRQQSGAPYARLDELMQKLAGDRPIGRLLELLNSTDQLEFQRLARDYDRGLRPAATTKHELILPTDEGKPRHAASLFTAAHFKHITPGEFMEIADHLAAHTPSRTVGRNDAHSPTLITDQVLAECGIGFFAGSNGVVAVIGAAEESGRQTTDSAMSDAIRDFFANDAALLKERYLLALAMRMTLGHASEKIVRAYRNMELEALRSAWAANPDTVKERLRRIVFGYPAFARADEAFFRDHQRELLEALARAMYRAPQLIADLARENQQFSVNDAVAALCSATPFDPEKIWAESFDAATAQFFLLAFSNDDARVQLSGYPAFFGRNDMEAQAGKSRRAAILATLNDAWRKPKRDAILEQLDHRLQGPQVLTGLLYEVAREFDNLVYDDKEPFAAMLLCDASCEYLRRGLRGKAWSTLISWPGDAEIAKALFSRDRRFAIWLDPLLRFNVRWSAELERKAQVRAEEGFRSWLIAVLALDALVGCASLGDRLESLSWNAFMLYKLDLGHAPRDLLPELLERCDFANQAIWECLCDPEETEHVWTSDEGARKFKAAVTPLFDAFPMLLLMAATRAPRREDEAAPTFVFSEELRTFLTSAADSLGSSVVEGLQNTVKTTLALQSEWRSMANQWQFPRAAFDQWRTALREREAALQAFQRALQPLRREARLRPAVTAPGTAPPA